MNYLILTETEFFGLINGNDETINLNAAYGCFVKAVVELLSDNDTDGVKIALAYAENELEYHNTQYLAGGVKSHTDLFVRKALSFVTLFSNTPVSSAPTFNFTYAGLSTSEPVTATVRVKST